MKKNHSLRIILIIIIGLLIVGVFFGTRYFYSTTVAEPTSTQATATAKGSSRQFAVTVDVVKSQRVLDGIHAIGSFVANEQVELASDVSGKVMAIYFDEGQKVEKGELLLKINDDDLQAQMRRYQYQLTTLSQKLERQRVLLKNEAVSQEAFDAVQTEYNVLNADIDILKVKINRSSICAPFSGVVGFKYVSDGAYIQPGTRIAELVDYSHLKLEFSIPEKYISMSLIGKTVYFTTEGSDKERLARIYAAEPKVDDQTRSIILRALYVNSGERLRPGMSARITIPTAAATERLLIPTQAVIPAMDGKTVWVVVNGKAHSAPIETGTRLEKDVEVIKGLKMGDTIVVTGIMQLSEGVSLKF